ncbi:MAG: glycosyltransferase [Candidatus Magasanikbacteria bacterium]
MRIALIHDYLSQDGGAERVLKALHEIWPSAPIFVLFHDRKKINYFDNEKIRESWLAKMPFVDNIFQWYLPFMPMATEQHDLRNFDVVISSTSIFAKGIITSPDTLHISYCHTPPRFLWGDGNNYLSDLKSNYFVKLILPLLNHRLRMWDQMSTQRVDHFIANSQTVQKRIKKYYRRDSEIIFPPVDTHRFQIASTLGDYYVAGGRLVPYKRLDLVVKVFNRLQLPLKIFGIGPEYKHLKRIAKPNVEFYGKISENEKAVLFSRALAFIHPQKEDFGITPIEAMSAGRPVIAYGYGGATETIIPNETGVFFYEQTWESLLNSILNFDPYHWDSEKIRLHTQKFSCDKFKNNIQSFTNDHFAQFQNSL